MLSARVLLDFRLLKLMPPLFAGAVSLALIGCGDGGNSNPDATDGQRYSLVSTKAASSDGAWSTVGSWPFIPIHAGVLPDGRLITYGSTPDGEQGGHLQYDIWDPADGLGASSHLTLPNGTDVDTFCSAGLLMPQSGNFITASGDWRGRPNGYTTNRNKDVLSFNFRDNSVEKLPRSINRQRWYGTMTMMPSGEVLMQGGTCWQGTTSYCDAGEIQATTPEIYRPSIGWQMLSGARSDSIYGESGAGWWYPRSWVAPDGRVFGISRGSDMYYLNANGQGAISRAGSLGAANIGNNGSAVMYRPGKILIVGGGSESADVINPNGLATARVIDINSGNPSVSTTQALNVGRQWLNATVLANGQVLVTGGGKQNNVLAGATRNTAIWDPDTGVWSYGSSASKSRLYHSSAILLPDARVWTGGGGAPGPVVQKNAEVYAPPYLFAADNTLATRPSLTNAPTTISWGSDQFTASVAGAEPISKVTFVAVGSVTHSFDMNQRYMELPFSQDGATLRVDKPSNANVAPPGYYMLFVFNGQGVPSVARIIRVVADSLSASPDLEGSGINVVDDPAIGGGGNGSTGGETGDGTGAGGSTDPDTGGDANPGNGGGSCNELSNGNFENGSANWYASTAMSVVNDAARSGQMLRFTNGWVGNKTLRATGGQSYTVSGLYQSQGSGGWAGFGLDYMNAAGERIGQKVADLAPGSGFKSFSITDTVPANTTEIRLWIFAGAGRTLIIDDVTLGRTDCNGGTGNGNNTGGGGDTDTGGDGNAGGGNTDGGNTGNNTGGGNTGAGSGDDQASCNGLTNGGFEDGQASWYSSTSMAVVTDAASGTGAIRFADGWVGNRIQGVVGGQSYTLRGTYKTTGSAGWIGAGLDYLSATGSRLGDKVADLDRRAGYGQFTVTDTVPAGTTEIRFWLFSGAGGTTTLDNVSLGRTDCASGSNTDGGDGTNGAGSDDPDAGSDPGGQTDNGGGDSTNNSCNVLGNGGFENQTSNWQLNASTTVVSDAHSGANAARFSGGWIGNRTLSAVSGARYRFSAQYKASGSSGWAGFGLDYLGANGARLGDFVADLPNSSTYTGLNPEVTLPTGTAEVRLWIYGDSGRVITVDSVDLREASCQ